MLTIAELPTFIRRASKLLNEREHAEMISYIADHPETGTLLEGTGGIRKIRWRRGNQGKSSGVRVLYYFYNEYMPLYLLTLFAKGDRTNLSVQERQELADLASLLKQTWKGAQH